MGFLDSAGMNEIIKLAFLAFIVISVVKWFHIDQIFIALWLGRRVKLPSDDDPDILRRQKVIRYKAGRANIKGLDCTHLELRGDEYAGTVPMGKIKGIILDRRIMEIWIKHTWLSRKAWIMVPNELIESDVHNKTLVIRANGLRPWGMGIFHIPVLGLHDIEKEELFYTMYREYLHNLLWKAGDALLQERAIHNALKAPGTDKIDMMAIMQDDYMSQNDKVNFSGSVNNE